MNDAIHLARDAKIVRSQMLGEAKSFTGFSVGCQEESVPSGLLALVTMILEGPSVKDHSVDRSPAALSIARLLKFNSTKWKRDNASSAHVKRSVAQETPVPRYIGLICASSMTEFSVCQHRWEIVFVSYFKENK